LGGEVLSFLGEDEIAGEVSFHGLPGVKEEGCLEDFRVEKGVGGLGFPKLFDEVQENQIAVGWAGLESVALAFPIILGGGGDAVAVVALADHEALGEFIEGFLDLGKLGVGVGGGMEGGGDVFGGAVDALDVLEEANGLGNGLRERVVHGGFDGVDLTADFAGDVAGNEIVDVVQAGESAEGLVRDGGGGVDEELLSDLDDGAVGSADMGGGAAP
jgi:hypothetical protein